MSRGSEDTHDIEHRLRASEAFLDRVGRIAGIAGIAGIGGWQYDLRTAEILWSDYTYRIHEVEPTYTPTLDTALTFYPPEARTQVEHAVKESIATGATWDIEVPFITAKQNRRWVRSLGAAEFENGVAVRLIGAFQDITPQKTLEEQLRQSNAELAELSSLLHTVLASASAVSIIATDCDQRITIFNSGAEALLGYAAGEVIGQVAPQLVHRADELRKHAAELSAKTARDVGLYDVLVAPETLTRPREFTYVRKDGTPVPVSVVVTAMQSGAGNATGYLFVAHDETQHRQAERSLRNAMRKEQDANYAKSRFVANLSHEIRTPLNAILGLSYLLGQTDLEASQRDTIAKISVAGRSLLTVINDVLDLSKIEAGERVVEDTPFDLPAAVEAIVDVLRATAEAKSIGLHITFDGDVPRDVSGDPARLRQILTNVIANAIKFTSEGEVRVSVHCVAQSEAQFTLQFRVQDTGIGIDLSGHTRLFEPFAQADASTTRRFGGTGLGLSIVKNLTRLMNGEVSVASELGVGTEFAVQLPFRRVNPLVSPRPMVARAPAPDDLAGLRILVAADSEVNREVAKRILELSGASVSVLNDGSQALEQLRATPQGFDLVLMDVQMPHMDGNAAARAIRNELGLRDLPIVALTAGATLSERAESNAAGMSAFVSKPFDPADLLAVIRRLVGRTPTTPLPLVPSRPPVPPWAQLPGINPDGLGATLRKDEKLFTKLLSHMLEEFEDVASAPEPVALDALPELGRRMHKLKGSSGALGATKLYDAAGLAERACVDGDAERASRCVATVASALNQLREGFARHGASDAVAAPAQQRDSVDLAREIPLLHTQLRTNDLEALENVTRLTPALREHMGDEPFARFHKLVDALQFETAASALADAVRT